MIQNGNLYETKQAFYHGIPIIFFPLFDKHHSVITLIDNIHSYTVINDIFSYNSIKIEDLIKFVMDSTLLNDNAKKTQDLVVFENGTENAISTIYWYYLNSPIYGKHYYDDKHQAESNTQNKDNKVEYF